jgi:hypothetical protein
MKPFSTVIARNPASGGMTKQSPVTVTKRDCFVPLKAGLAMKWSRILQKK